VGTCLRGRAGGLFRGAKFPFKHLGQSGSDERARGGSGNASIAALATEDLARTGLLGKGDFDLIELGEKVERDGSNISGGWKSARKTSLGQVARDETLLGGGQGIKERVVVVLGLGAVGDTGELVGATGSLFGTGPVREAGHLTLGNGSDDGQKESNDDFHHGWFWVWLIGEGDGDSNFVRAMRIDLRRVFCILKTCRIDELLLVALWHFYSTWSLLIS
jgi:hypothetical protein